MSVLLTAAEIRSGSISAVCYDQSPQSISRWIYSDPHLLGFSNKKQNPRNTQEKIYNKTVIQSLNSYLGINFLFFFSKTQQGLACLSTRFSVAYRFWSLEICYWIVVEGIQRECIARTDWVPLTFLRWNDVSAALCVHFSRTSCWLFDAWSSLGQARSVHDDCRHVVAISSTHLSPLGGGHPGEILWYLLNQPNTAQYK